MNSYVQAATQLVANLDFETEKKELIVKNFGRLSRGIKVLVREYLGHQIEADAIESGELKHYLEYTEMEGSISKILDKVEDNLNENLDIYKKRVAGNKEILKLRQEIRELKKSNKVLKEALQSWENTVP